MDKTMPTRMKHPIHGYTHAYNTNDLDYLKGLGWSVDEPEVKDEEGDVIAAYVAKFGKKPHHFTKLETIKKALDDHSD